MKSIIIIVFGLGGLLLSCTPSELPAKKYVQWIENPENGLRKVREIGDYRLTFQYQSPDYLDLKQSFQRGGPEAVVERQKDVSTLAHFELKIGSKDGKTPLLRQGVASSNAYQERVQYLAFEQEHRIFLFSKTDTLQPLLYHFERSYDLHSSISCSLAFSQLPTDDFSLLIDDTHLGLGPIYFSFNIADFQAIPALK